MWIIVGLGNPGAEYARTRHNVGFMVVDQLAERWHIVLRPDGIRHLGRGRVADRPTTLIEPQTYMNRSGDALADLTDPDARLVVVYDDLDLPAGALRVRRHGATGGHRGLASIVERWGAECIRVRLGIGRPPEGVDVVDHVLTPPTAAEHDLLAASVQRAAAAVECIVTEGVETAMNRFNSRATAAPE